MYPMQSVLPRSDFFKGQRLTVNLILGDGTFCLAMSTNCDCKAENTLVEMKISAPVSNRNNRICAKKLKSFHL